MTKDYHKMNIPKLPVFTAEDGIKTIRELFGNLLDWKNINDLIPQHFKIGKGFKKTNRIKSRAYISLFSNRRTKYKTI